MSRSSTPTNGRDARYLRSGDLADRLGVHRTTVIKWIRGGKLVPDRRSFGGQALFRPSTAERLARRHATRD